MRDDPVLIVASIIADVLLWWPFVIGGLVYVALMAAAGIMRIRVMNLSMTAHLRTAPSPRDAA